MLADIRGGQTARCLLPWIPLVQGGDRADTVMAWKELADQESEHQLRQTYAALALVFADLADCLPVWKQGLEGWNMRKSRIIEEWREEGRIETLQDIVLRRLQKRFPGVSSPEVLAAVQAQKDADELMRWLDLIDSMASLEAFRTAINV